MAVEKTWFYQISRLIGLIICKLYFRISAKGLSNIPKTGPVLLVSNHASYIDPFLDGVLIPRPIHFMARSDLWNIKFLAWWIPKVHGIPIRRTGFDRQAVQTALDYLKNGEIVLIYPEGTRSVDGKLKPGMPGVGMMAHQAKVLVIPIYISGSFAAFSRKARFPKPKKITVYYGPLLDLQTEFNLPEEKETYQAITLKIMDAIHSLSPTGE
ncbi:MAG: lysophospholipid acyltransferase family protein [bacterium]|nr:lysophospholipid acyltransferase family protein [bacterium]